MSNHERVEKARAADEARRSAPGRAGGSPSRTEEALKRYLATETFREHRHAEEEREDDTAGKDKTGQ